LTIAEDQAGMSTSPDPSASAGYTVLARRYRPARFEDCVGQEHVAQAITNAIDSQRVAHAYLFCGSRGVGKTSMARIFAKALNCEKGPTGQPCGVCESCQSITAGSDLDVVEIDGASNRGIEEIRELRAGVAYRPSRSRFKIYIIDEVHMLTKEAFNALLKTLEEPPGHVKFVFATTEPQKIPITILSRCQRYDFAGIGLEQIRHRLAEIVAAEGMTADDEALEIVARRARGSMRDSQSLLDQVLAYAAGHLTAEVVHRLLGTAGEERVLSLGQAIFQHDAAQSLRIVDQAVGEGIQLGEWVDQMLDFFRDLLVLTVDPAASLLSMAERNRLELARLIEGRSTERIMEMMDILASSRQRLRGSPFGRTIVEMTVVRLCRLDQFLSLSVLESSSPVRSSGSVTAPAKKNGCDRLTSGETDDGDGGNVADRLAAAGQRLAQASAVSPTPVDEEQPAPATCTTVSSVDVVSAEPLSKEVILKHWPTVRKAIADPFLSASLEQVTEVAFDPPRTITLKFPATSTVSKARCEQAVDVIRPTWEQALGQQVSIRFDQKEADPAAPSRSISRSPLQLREEASRDPLVQQAEMLLGARIFDVTVLPTHSVPVGSAEDETDKRS
jgi:DNA polymerase-3 subunit gamma/tau